MYQRPKGHVVNTTNLVVVWFRAVCLCLPPTPLHACVYLTICLYSLVYQHTQCANLKPSLLLPWSFVYSRYSFRSASLIESQRRAFHLFLRT